ncbi:hypothetical protein GCM10022239_00570 [Leifsonia bigeumensis]|uniref:Uncharacterized protein n=1 Tax=Leifsonella bigeumensis TaxID=433643 RepID=A0ABP7F051_9MICO
MRRLLGASATAAVLAVVLSGCSLWHDGEDVVGQVQEGIVAHQVLTELTDELRARDGVESAESSVVPIYRTASVTVALRDGVPASTIGEVATRIDDVLRGPDLQPFDREFSVQAGDAGIRQTSFERTPVDYAAELAYWGEIQSVVGTGLTMTLGADRAGALQRILSTQTDATVATLAEHYDDIAATVPPAGTATMWRLPGILGYADWLGPLPERSILTFMAAMAAVTNLLDDSVQETPPGFYTVLSDSRRSFPPRFALVANAPGTEVDADATWQLTLSMARGALATGLPAFQVAVQGYGDDSFSDANFHVGDCADVNPPTASDHKLVADLADAGIPLPADAAAGICLAFATP